MILISILLACLLFFNPLTFSFINKTLYFFKGCEDVIEAYYTGDFTEDMIKFYVDYHNKTTYFKELENEENKAYHNLLLAIFPQDVKNLKINNSHFDCNDISRAQRCLLKKYNKSYELRTSSFYSFPVKFGFHYEVYHDIRELYPNATVALAGPNQNETQ